MRDYEMMNELKEIVASLCNEKFRKEIRREMRDARKCNSRELCDKSWRALIMNDSRCASYQLSCSKPVAFCVVIDMDDVQLTNAHCDELIGVAIKKAIDEDKARFYSLR